MNGMRKAQEGLILWRAFYLEAKGTYDKKYYETLICRKQEELYYGNQL